MRRSGSRMNKRNGSIMFRPRLELLEHRNLLSFADGFGAVVTNLKEQNNGAELVITFDGPLDANPANPVQSPTNTGNYSIQVPIPAQEEVVTSSSSQVAITNATYTPDSSDPTNGPSTVTLSLASPLIKATNYRVFINGSSNVSNPATPGLIDDYSHYIPPGPSNLIQVNQPIDGDYDDTPSGDFYKLFAWTTAGTALNYTDFSGDQVQLTLTGPGTLEAWRELDGDFDATALAGQVEASAGAIQQVSVFNGVLGQTKLSGSAVFEQGRGTYNGIVIPSIVGDGVSFTNALPTYFQYTPVAAPLPSPTPVLATAQNLPYTLELEPINDPSNPLVGPAASVPAVQSATYAVDQVAGSPFNGYWLLFGGRTNGRHGFVGGDPDNFPPDGQNLNIIVINPVTFENKSLLWSATDIPSAVSASLYSSNQQFVQAGDTLYTTGGYGFDATSNATVPPYETYDTLTALSVDGMIKAVMNGGDVAALSQLQQIHDLRFQVTGGVLAIMDNVAYQIQGQDFQGNYAYNDPVATQTYVDEISSFKINYNGNVPNSLSISDYQAQNDQVNFRRRDFNFGQVMQPVQGQPEPASEIFGGVFQPGPTIDPFAAAYRSQVVIQGIGVTQVNQYQQYFSQYDAPNIGLYDAPSQSMYTISFGGISLYTYNLQNGQLTVAAGVSSPATPGYPFTNNVTTLERSPNASAQEVLQNPDGINTQEYEMPSQFPGLYGAEAAYFAAPGLPQYANGVLKLDQIKEPTVLGYIYGGIFAPTPLGSTQTTATGAIFKVVLVPTSQTVGTFDPKTGTWYLRNSNNSGSPDFPPFAYGAPHWIPVTGDWNGDGTTTIGVVDPTTETWYLRNSNSSGAPSYTPFQFGAPGWIPVVGDWTGTGHTGIGVYDPSAGKWYLRSEVGSGTPDAGAFIYGAPDMIPVAGDWTGVGHAGVGVFNPSTANWYLRTEVSAGDPDANPNDAPFGYGMPGWQPVVGDWSGQGRITIGVVDPSTQTWYLRNSNSSGAPDFPTFSYGAPGWGSVAGNWGAAPLAQLAAGGEALGTAKVSALTDQELQSAVAGALARLRADGVNQNLVSLLASIQFSVGSLPFGDLALSYVNQNRVVLDPNAAGYGWFVDPTPLRDEEFTSTSGRQVAGPGSPAAGHMDLLTVLLHEMGHFNGWTELDPSVYADSLMALTLGADIRRTQDVDAVFALDQGVHGQGTATL
jgi:hypothetical protein